MMDDFISEIALELDETVENVGMTVAFLIKHGIMEQTSETQYFIPGVTALLGSETDSAERVRRHRERLKNSLALPCNVTVTGCNGEIESEKNKDKHKTIRSETVDEIVSSWNSLSEKTGTIPKIITIGKTRSAKLSLRIKEGMDFLQVIKKI
jgi:hypothetical protein